jgi:multidrug efflux pump subunit AcrB
MYIAFTSDQMTPYQITDYLLRSVQPELATLDGVGKAAIFGRYLAMRIWLDPVRMAALGVTASDIAAGDQARQRDQHRRRHRGRVGPVTVDASHRHADGGGFPRPGRASGRRSPGAPRRRRGRRTGAENNQMRSFSQATTRCSSAITPAPDANPAAVSRAVRQAVPDIEANLPADMTMFLDWDGSVAIDHALRR